MSDTKPKRRKGRITQGTYAAKTMERLRKDGWLNAKVERWVQFGRDDPRTSGGENAKARTFKGPPGIRVDLFGIGDVLAIKDAATLLVQCCSMDRMADHLAMLYSKLIEDPRCEGCRVPKKDRTCKGHLASMLWLAGGTRTLELWGWRTLLVKPGGVARRWQPSIREIRLEDLEGRA